MLPRYLLVELLKLRRSLALLLCLAAPACVAILATMIQLDGKKAAPLGMYGLATSGLWSFAMLPLTVTALSVVMAQMEHGARTWDHVLTLPGARPNIYLAKALTMLGLVGAMSALLFVLILAGGEVVRAFAPHGVTGSIDRAALALTLARMAAAICLVCVLQLWVALRFRSFVPPLVFGIGGTFVAVAATSARQGVYFPWLMSVNILSTDPARQQLALMLGGLGGLAALGLMLVHLHFREA